MSIVFNISHGIFLYLLSSRFYIQHYKLLYGTILLEFSEVNKLCTNQHITQMKLLRNI